MLNIKNIIYGSTKSLSQSFFHQGTILTDPGIPRILKGIGEMSQSFFHQGTILTFYSVSRNKHI